MVIMVVFGIRYASDPHSTTVVDTLVNGLLGTLPSSVIAVIFGVPFALWISRKSESERRDSEGRTEFERFTKRQVEILLLARRELDMNRVSIIANLNVVGSGNQITVPGPSVALWQSILSSGDTRYISNSDTLVWISEAYHAVQALIRIADIYYQNLRFVGLTTSPPSKNDLVNFSPGVIQSIDTALLAIETQLTLAQKIGPGGPRRRSSIDQNTGLIS
jgi:hypothetical protein